MDVCILTTAKEDKPEDSRLIEEAEARGHNARRIYVPDCTLAMGEGEPDIYYRDERIGDAFNIIIPRIDVKHAAHGLAVVRQFWSIGKATVTESAESIGIARDKVLTGINAGAHGLSIPYTEVAYSPEAYEVAIDRVLKNTLIHMPGNDKPESERKFVMKVSKGTEGAGVFLVNKSEAMNILTTLHQKASVYPEVVFQELVEESFGTDLRIFVVGGRVVASMQRKARDPKEMRANISAGGTGVPYELNAQEEDLALNAMDALGLNVGGVDVMLGKVPRLVEVNAAADFYGNELSLERVTGVNVAGAIVDHALERWKLDFEQRLGVEPQGRGNMPFPG